MGSRGWLGGRELRRGWLLWCRRLIEGGEGTARFGAVDLWL